MAQKTYIEEIKRYMYIYKYVDFKTAQVHEHEFMQPLTDSDKI